MSDGRAKMSDGRANALPCPPLATPMPAGTSSLAVADGHGGFIDPKDSMDQLRASGLSTLKVLL